MQHRLADEYVRLFYEHGISPTGWITGWDNRLVFASWNLSNLWGWIDFVDQFPALAHLQAFSYFRQLHEL